MTDSDDVHTELLQAASSSDFIGLTAELVSQWSRDSMTLATVDAIIRFMEDHPSLEFGTPGPLVHFVEQFYRNGYEERLVESVKRAPTPHTVWLLNRIINGATAADERAALIATMADVVHNPRANAETLERARFFLERLT